jgi:DNA (cytosine-5)-methyltransferase 1
MKVGSLFSGVGGFDLGLERSGHEIVWQVEYDKQARSILRKHWPDVKIYNDVQQVGGKDGEAGRDVLEEVDLICGGFPCQDLSVAGHRRGLDGSKSGLWYEFHRILEECRPKYCLVENVPGLFSSNKGRDMEVLVRGLEELGYQWQYRILDSQHFGVPQRRRRVFIVGYLGDGCQSQVLLESESLPWHPAQSREEGQNSAGDAGCSDEEGGRTLYRGEGFSSYREDDLAAPLRASQSKQADTDLVVARCTGYAKYKMEDEMKASSPLRARHNEATDLVVPRIFQQNTRDEVRYMNGDGQLAGALPAQPGSKQQNYIAFQPGNLTRKAGANPSTEVFPTLGAATLGDQAPHVATHQQVAPTLNSSGAGTSRPGGQGAEPGFYISSNAPRRLTPRECERLQGFPDDWTRWTDTGQEMADGPRYRMMGNAVTVNVAEFIGAQLKSVIPLY